jgi:hypothetical protein
MSNRQGTMGTHTCKYVHACGDGRDKKAAAPKNVVGKSLQTNPG